MKLLTLLCVAGLAAASATQNPFKWSPGHEYTWQYKGRLLSGLPDLASHYSGLGLKCTVHLQVESATDFAVRISEAKYARVSDVLHGSGGDLMRNWRSLSLPQYSEVPAESARLLASPTLFKLKSGGEFESITVSGEEPEWSINFKKAIVVLFQTKFHQMGNSEMSSNIDFWQTEEESLDGVCDVTYQINELPQYIIKDKPELIPTPSACEGHDQYYEVIRTKDVGSCSKQTSFSFYKPGFVRCGASGVGAGGMGGNCAGLWSRSSVTRYIACGPKSALVVQRIINEGEMVQDLMGFKAEKLVTGNKQELKLVEKKPIGASSKIGRPSRPVTLRKLFYVYRFKQTSEEEHSELVSQSEMESGPSSVYQTLPRHMLFTGSASEKHEGRHVDPSKLVPQIKKLFHELVNEDLFNPVDVPKKEVTMKALSLARSFSLLDKNTISTIYGEMKSEFSGGDKQNVFKNIFFDTLIMGGSYDNVVFIKEKIQSNELSTAQIASVVTLLPNYVTVPSRGLLEIIFEMFTCPEVHRSPFNRNQAILAFSTLMQKACIAQNRRSSYPTNVYGEFCHPESRIVTQKWIPYLQNQLRSSSSVEQKHLIIVSLGLLGHKNVVPILLPYIEGSSGEQGSNAKATRFLAVYSLRQAGVQNPDLVMPIALAILSNRAEATEVRIAAFNIVLRMNPSMSVFNRVAALTWQETDNEVLQVINTAFLSLANQKEMDAMQSYGASAHRKAAIVYPLIKKIGGAAPSSATLFTSDYLPSLSVGYERVTSWISSKRSYAPTDFYSKVAYLLDRYQYDTLEFAAHFSGGESFFRELSKVLMPGHRHETTSELEEKIKETLSSEWREVIEKLRLGSGSGRNNRESGPTQGSVYLSVLESTPIFQSFHAASSEMLREKLSSVMKNPSNIKESICGRTNVNMQKMIDLSPAEFTVPSEMGFPIVIERHMPVVVSLKGEMNVQCIPGRVLPSVQMKIKTLFASQLTGWVGTVLPFTKEFLVTGVDEHSVVNFPTEFDINLDVTQQELSVKIAPVSGVSGEIDLFHYHIRPFTVNQKLWNLEPMTLNPSVKFIRSPTPVKTMQKQIGNFLGLDVKAIIKTESHFTDLRAVVEKIKFYNSNPLNMLRFGWASTAISEKLMPSLRSHEIKLKYNPSSSSTKEIEIKTKIGFATKEKDRPIKYHLLKKMEESEFEKTYPSLRKLFPWKVISKNIDEVSEHRQRKDSIKEIVEHTGIESGISLSVTWSMILQGSSRHTYSYNMNLATGSQQMKQKWNLQMQCATSGNKICVRGDVAMPTLPMWNIDEIRNTNIEYRYNNMIGFGSTCQESQIRVSGHSKVSEKQKEHSRKSPEAEIYKKMLEKRIPLSKLSEVAEKVRGQAATMDEVDYTVEYHNVPVSVMKVRQYLLQYLKAEFWPYYMPNESRIPGPRSFSEGGISQTNRWSIRFDTTSQTFDLRITSGEESAKTLVFKHIRLHYFFGYLFPAIAHNPSKSLGSLEHRLPLYGSCSTEGRWVKSYDNVTLDYNMDACYHMLSGDCSINKRFAILTRSTGNSAESPKEIKVLVGKSTFLLTPSSHHSRYSSSIELRVNGTQAQIPTGRGKHIIRDPKGVAIADIIKSTDGVITLQTLYCPIVGTPTVAIHSDGHKIKVETSKLYKGSLCGICGDMNGQKVADRRGPGNKCVYSKPEVLAASYRVSLRNHECSPLPSHIEQELRRETEVCAKYEEIPTKVIKSYESQTGPCTRHTHEMLERPAEICFSRLPVTDCSPRCQPTSRDAVVSKSVSFTCLRKGRLADRYVDKVNRGEVIQQLAHQRENFVIPLPLPRSCVPVSPRV